MICEILETTHKPKEFTNKLINQTQNSSDRIMNKCIYRSHLHALVEHRHYYDFLCRWFRRHCAYQLRKCKFKFRSTKSSTSRLVVVVVIIVNWSAAQLDNISYIYVYIVCVLLIFRHGRRRRHQKRCCWFLIFAGDFSFRNCHQPAKFACVLCAVAKFQCQWH